MKKPVGRYPKHIERQYTAAVRRLLQPMFKNTTEYILPQLPRILDMAASELKTDSYGDEITQMMNNVQLITDVEISDQAIKSTVADYANKTNNFDRAQFRRQSKAVLGVELATTETWFTPLATSWIQENTALIKTVESRYFSQVESLVRNAATTGTSTKKLTAQIYKLQPLADGSSSARRAANNNARRIARDQIGKLNGAIARKRQQSAGVDYFIWATQDDSAVRSKHRQFDDKRYSWETGAPGGIYPGQEIQCRCVALPDFSDLI